MRKLRYKELTYCLKLQNHFSRLQLYHLDSLKYCQRYDRSIRTLLKQLLVLCGCKLSDTNIFIMTKEWNYKSLKLTLKYVWKLPENLSGTFRYEKRLTLLLLGLSVPKHCTRGSLFIHSSIYYLTTLCPALWSRHAHEWGALCPRNRNLSKQIWSQDIIPNFLLEPFHLLLWSEYLLKRLSTPAQPPQFWYHWLVGLKTSASPLSSQKHSQSYTFWLSLEIRLSFNILSTLSRHFQHCHYFSLDSYLRPHATVNLRRKFAKFSSGIIIPPARNSFPIHELMLERLCRWWQLVKVENCVEIFVLLWK